MGEPFSVKVLTDIVGALRSRRAVLMWSLALCVWAVLAVIFADKLLQFNKASYIYDNYLIYLLVAAVCLPILAAFKSYDEVTARKRIFIVPDENRCRWYVPHYHEMIKSPYRETIIDLLFNVNNTSDEEFKLLDAKLIAPAVRPSVMKSKSFFIRSAEMNKYDKTNRVPAHEDRIALASFEISKNIWRSKSSKKITVMLLDQRGQQHKVKIRHVRNDDNILI
jgi:hypothetical protein